MYKTTNRPFQISKLILVLGFGLGFPFCVKVLAVEVELDAKSTPHLQDWGKNAVELSRQWYPRISNLLPTKDFSPPKKMLIKINDSDQGVGATLGNTISISSHWIEKHPDDVGLVIHELVHVVQSYPPGGPGWITEGIADYLRWGIFEGKNQDWFPRPREKKGYQKGYRVAAGFLLWLESDLAPGIVKKLNTAMRNKEYSDSLFEKESGQTLDQLWDMYTRVTVEK